MKKYKQHELSACYPLYTAEQQQEVADDIRDQGQNHPIELYEGEILDGWNRYLCCQLAGVEPWFTDVTSELKGRDLWKYVESNNGKRRHLSVKNRALAAAKLSETNYYKTRAKASQGTRTDLTPVPGGTDVSERATHIAAREMGVSPRSTKRAAKVLKDGAAATKKALEDDQISLNKAAAIAKLPKAEQPEAVKQAKEPKKPKNGRIKPNKGTLFRICEQSFGKLYRAALDLGIDEDKYGKHFEAIIKEVNRLGSKK